MKEEISILIFEKDENIASMLHEFMQMSEIDSRVFNSHDEAYESFSHNKSTICLIALEKVPDKEFALAQKIKEAEPDTILIFTCADPSIEVITRAYASGADDLVRKPFIMEELYLRTLAIVKRTHGIKAPHDKTYHLGNYLFDIHKQTLSIGNTCTKLTTKESDLLKYLCENINTVVDRADILKNVWNNNTYFNARSMDVYLTKLRRHLHQDTTISIVNIHGKGFKLTIKNPALEMRVVAEI